MAFSWKEKKDIWKGEGIYFLTFNVRNRACLLGILRRLTVPDSEGHIAAVDATDLGKMVYKEFNALLSKYKGFYVVAKQIMPNHFHAVCWCKSEFGDTSIKMVARSFSQAISKVARTLYQQQLQSARSDRADTNGMSVTVSHPLPFSHSQALSASPYECGNGANTLFEKPFIRTLSHAGQLRNMIDYTHANPDNLLRILDNPDFYVIRRNQRHGGLLFDTMGKTRLLDYPDKHVVALSRSLTPEQIATEVSKALWLAESGAVTYCAAINDAEKAVTKAIRSAGYPLVVMMLDGFPPEGTDASRYFHPNGVYHEACGRGLLYLMAPSPANYNDPRVIELTDRELARKAAAKHLPYTPIPHNSKRWRMIAGNIMLTMV